MAVGFGPLMLLGAYVVQTGGTLSWEPFVASLPIALLVTLILYVNEIPDRRGDARAGKRTLPVRFPESTVIAGYVVAAGAAYVIVVAGVVAGILPIPALLALLTIPLARQVARGLRPNYDNPYGLMAIMGVNVKVHLYAGLLLLAAYAVVLLAGRGRARRSTCSSDRPRKRRCRRAGPCSWQWNPSGPAGSSGRSAAASDSGRTTSRLAQGRVDREVGRTERGDWRHLRVATLDRIATAVGARLEVRGSPGTARPWTGCSMPDHAALVEQTVRRLRGLRLARRRRGLVQHPRRARFDRCAGVPRRGRAMRLIVEVKSVIPDVQATLMTLDRKVRLAREIAAERGWDARSTSGVSSSSASRGPRADGSRLTRPCSQPRCRPRAVAIRSWLRRSGPSRRTWPGCCFCQPASRRPLVIAMAPSRQPSAAPAHARAASESGKRASSSAPTGGRVTRIAVTNVLPEAG